MSERPNPDNSEALERFVERQLNNSSTRRALLRATVVGGTALAGALFGVRFSDRIYPTTPEAVDIPAYDKEELPLLVKKGVNIRTSPQIPDRNRIIKPDNTVDWNEIETVNGVSIEDKDSFVIVGAPIVIGQPAEHPYPTPEEGRYGYGWSLPGDKWIKIWIKRAGKEQEEPVYINNSQATKEFVSYLHYDFDGAGLREASDLFTPYGPHTYVPNSAETAAREIIPYIWSSRARDILDASSRLTTIEVVAAGNSLEEREEMERAGTPVNLRNFPATSYTDGEPVEIVAKLPQGTIINNALAPLHHPSIRGFAIFRVKDIRGVIPGLSQEERGAMEKRDEIVAISDYYLKY